MKRIIIEGMVCEHCANAVKNALEELGGTNIKVDLEGGFADAEIDVPDARIISRIAEEDFDVKEIR